MSPPEVRTAHRGDRSLTESLTLGGVVAFTSGLLAVLFLEIAPWVRVRVLGRFLEKGYFTSVMGAAVVTGMLAVLPVSNREKKALVMAWCFKAAVALGPMLVRDGRWRDSLYGFVSYQNLGTAVRFQAVGLPPLLLAGTYPWLSSRPGRETRRTLLGASG